MKSFSERCCFQAGGDAAGCGVATRTLVLGMGLTGVSFAHWLAARGQSAVFADNATQPSGAEAIAGMSSAAMVHTGGIPATVLEGIDQVLVSPGFRPDTPVLASARDRGIPVLSDIEVFMQHVDVPCICVTGSNGKSSVVTLVTEICNAAGLHASSGGNIGTPALELLLQEDLQTCVLELSSFQLQRTANMHSRAATVLNISEDHLDWHATMAEYRDAKLRVYENCDVAVVNRELALASREIADKVISFGRDRPKAGQYGIADDASGAYLMRGDQRLLSVRELHLRGMHNCLNALAAMALSEALGIAPQEMLASVRNFRGLRHRAQVVAKAAGVTYINDSKATNVAAAAASLGSLEGPAIWIAGGDAKGQKLAPLSIAARDTVRGAVLIGKDRHALAETLSGVCPVEFADSLAEAVSQAKRLAVSGDSVLLAPACASQDMFRDYQDRGEQFELAVGELLQ